MSTWKKRAELPVYKQLTKFQFDPKLLVEAYEEYTSNKEWDGLGNEYSNMCQTYTKLPSMFFKDEDRKRNPSKQSNATNSMVDMIMGSTGDSREPQQVTVDAETLVAQTQDRMWRALKRRYQYDSNLKPAQAFLLNHINSKIPLVIMYVD